MAHARTIFLSEREEDLIHAQSIKTLETIGVKVHSQPVLKMLDECGAAVDYETMIARIPEKMVEDALATAPKEFALCARNPEHDLPMPAYPYPHSTTSGLAINVTDRHTGEHRRSTLKDAAEFAKLGDALDAVDFLWTSLTAGDVLDRAHGPHELWATMQNTSKHVQGVTVQSAEDARVQIDLAALIAGGREALRKRPLISVISCPIAPLSFEAGAIEAQVEFAKAGIPIASMSMSMGGLTAPVTIAGTITNANTENLASIVITQAACPGSPHIYTSESSPMDMRTGGMAYSSPDKTLLSFGLGQLAKRYRLPCLVADIGFGDELEGNVGAFGDVVVQCMGIPSQTDIMTGMGCVDSAKGICFEQLVIDAYIWESVRGFMKEVEITEERIGLDAMEAVGPGNHFLKSPHTIRYMREEVTQWDQRKVKMLSTDPATMCKEFRAIANQLLEDHKVLPIDEDLVRQGDEIIQAYERALAA